MCRAWHPWAPAEGVAGGGAAPELEGLGSAGQAAGTFLCARVWSWVRAEWLSDNPRTSPVLTNPRRRT